jgi:hypothetical protein
MPLDIRARPIVSIVRFILGDGDEEANSTRDRAQRTRITSVIARDAFFMITSGRLRTLV